MSLPFPNSCRLPPLHQNKHKKPVHKIPSITNKTPLEMYEISAQSWLYYTPTQQHGYKTGIKRQIASLTKIMTMICTLQICDKYTIDIKKSYFKITEWAVNTIGTTANLQANVWMSIEDIIYGMMLPSGNDAATVIAQNLGAVLYFSRRGNASLVQQLRSVDLTQDYENIKYYRQQFISYMNKKSKELKMNRTNFSNPHGLDEIKNYSCAEDVLIMSLQALSHNRIKAIVNTLQYTAKFLIFKPGKTVFNYVVWNNTNKLLSIDGIFGIKTGITNRAGGCLVTSFKLNNLDQGIIIVLRSKSASYRFKDTMTILTTLCNDYNDIYQ